MFILLVCNAGMSTSLIVNQMKKCIREQGKDYEIKAVALDSAYDYYDTADVILLGPQISIYINNVRKQSNKPVAVIDSKSYGRYRGDEVLLAAEKLFEESRK